MSNGSARGLTQLIWSGLHGAIVLPTNIDRIALLSAKAVAAEMIEVLLGNLRTPI